MGHGHEHGTKHGWYSLEQTRTIRQNWMMGTTSDDDCVDEEADDDCVDEEAGQRTQLSSASASISTSVPRRARVLLLLGVIWNGIGLDVSAWIWQLLPLWRLLECVAGGGEWQVEVVSLGWIRGSVAPWPEPTGGG